MRLSRLKFLVGGVIGGALGTTVAAFAFGSVSWRWYALAQATITSLHLMTQYANEYFDRECDTGSERTPFSGGSGALQEGSMPAATALAAAMVCAVLGIGGAALLISTGRTTAGTLALAIALLSWFYSAPPFRLLAHGVGELDTAFIVGILVPLCAYAAQTQTVDARMLASTLPLAGATFAMMICVEVPDVRVDAAGGKRTLVVRTGLKRAHMLVVLGLSLAVAGVVIGVLLAAPVTFAAMVAVALPAAIGTERALRQRRWEAPTGRAQIAARGVSTFFLIGVGSVLGYLVALP
ncbi:MAG: prenyltransferase [Candidatus Eremiobacteraeota bacterium]|nr:prenyltransferase [Candidatus Eremiobacteraeota bacterium]